MAEKKTRRVLDFPDDPAMQELHDIRRKIEKEIRGMNAQQINEYLEKKVKRLRQTERKRKVS